MENGKSSIIEEKSFEFALKIVGLYKRCKAQEEYILSKQLLRSGTSIGANVHEARSAVSTKDFINKMSLACKESRETYYWLKLMEKSELVNFKSDNLLKDNEEIVRILTSIIKTSKQSLLSKK